MPYLSFVIFLLCFVLVTLVQKIVSQDDWGEAAVKGAVMAVIAAVPFSVLTFIGRSIYKSIELVVGMDEERLFGKLGIKWREFEKLAKAKAISLNYRPRKNSQMGPVIAYLVKHGVIEVADAVKWDNLRKGRGFTTHEETPETINHLIAQSEQLMEKYKDRLL